MKRKDSTFVFMTLGVFIATYFIASQAFAIPTILNGWTFDLSAVHTGLTKAENVDRIDVSGTLTVTQDFGLDGVFNDGDTFSEFGFLDVLTYWVEPGTNGADHKSFDLTADDGTTYYLYLYGSGLTGEVYNVNIPDPTNPNTWSWNYTFDPGQGTLAMYLDTDDNVSNGVSDTLATWSVISPSGGQGPAGFLGGAQSNGTTDLTARFTSVYPGVWFTPSGQDFNDLIPLTIGLLNTNNRVLDYTPTQNGFIARVYSSGELNVAVPEPATMLLFGAGLLGLGGLGRKKYFKKG